MTLSSVHDIKMKYPQKKIPTKNLVQLFATMLFLTVLFVTVLLTGCVHNKTNTIDINDALVKELDLVDKEIESNTNGKHSREMSRVEAAHWVQLIHSVDSRLQVQVRYKTISENELFALKVRLLGLIEVATEDYAQFPPDIELDIKKIIAKIDRAIVSYSEPHMISVVEVPNGNNRQSLTSFKRHFQFIWPVSIKEVTSGFGMRKHPITGKISFHDAIDLGGKRGTLVYASERGRVVFAGHRGHAGLLVVIQHRDGFRSYYAHLYRLLTAKGLSVERGQPIGQIGSTGRSTGPHLHFKISQNKKAIDPDKIVGAILD